MGTRASNRAGPFFVIGLIRCDRQYRRGILLDQ